MIAFLDAHLPVEITDMIYREFHRQCMSEIAVILQHKVVFVLVDNQISFLICEGQNYYECLLD